MQSLSRFLLLAILVLQVTMGTAQQQLKVRRNDTTTLHLMVEPIGTNFGAFFGVDAGKKNVGSNNTLLGYGAGTENRTGNSNTFVGEIAGEGNKTGNNNTYIGRSSGRLSRGSDNIFLGVDAGSLNILGNRNTYIGNNAGVSSTGSDNVFIGRQAGSSEAGNHKLYIENSNADNTGALIYGEFDNNYLRANASMDIYGRTTVVNSGYGLGHTDLTTSIGTWVDGSAGWFGTFSNHPIWFFTGDNPTPSMVILNNTGYVGMGTANPSKLLHLYSGDDPTIKLQSDGVSEISGRVSMRQSNESGVDMYYEGVADELIFEPFTSGIGAGKKLTMNLAGNIGIGRSAGTFPLVIKSDVNSNLVQFYNNSDLAKWHLRLESNGALGFTESGVTDRRLVIAPGGNIGMGTTNAPSASLHIYATTEPTIKLQSDGFTENSGRVSMRQVNDTGGDLYYDGALDLMVLETFNAGVSDGRRMIIKQTTGDVGIGTTILATGHKLSVNGKIACTEVRVQPVNQWPDYVFAEDYTLMPLAQLKNEIDEHNHLPGIPSAEEIEKNGIQVGDMQTRMMEKIEELTLYIIDLNTKMEKLKEENVLQSIEIASLKKGE